MTSPHVHGDNTAPYFAPRAANGDGDAARRIRIVDKSDFSWATVQFPEEAGLAVGEQVPTGLVHEGVGEAVANGYVGDLLDDAGSRRLLQQLQQPVDREIAAQGANSRRNDKRKGPQAQAREPFCNRLRLWSNAWFGA